MTGMGKKLSPQVRDHLEWLGFIQPTGLVVSAHALVQAGAILNRRDIEGQELLKECVEERTVDPDREPEPYLPDFEVFARHVLGWSFSPKGLPTICQRFLKRGCNPASRGDIRPHFPPPGV